MQRALTRLLIHRYKASALRHSQFLHMGKSPRESEAKAARSEGSGRAAHLISQPYLQSSYIHNHNFARVAGSGNIPRLPVQMPEQRGAAVEVRGHKEVGMSALGFFVHLSGFEHGFSMAHRGSNLGAQSHDVAN